MSDQPSEAWYGTPGDNDCGEERKLPLGPHTILHLSCGRPRGHVNQNPNGHVTSVEIDGVELIFLWKDRA